MSTLTDEQKREIRQLWYVSSCYFNLADTIKPNCDENKLRTTVKMLSKEFDKGLPKDKKTKQLTMLVAHLASSAVRLGTIRDFNKGEFNDGYKGKYNKVKEENDDGKDKYMHLLLRDNIAHKENENSISQCLEQKKRFETIARARQDAIDQMSVSDIFSAMEKIIEKYKEKLQNQL